MIQYEYRALRGIRCYGTLRPLTHNSDRGSSNRYTVEFVEVCDPDLALAMRVGLTRSTRCAKELRTGCGLAVAAFL